MKPLKLKPMLRSFKPFADSNSKILILGTMPGPMALEKQEYYGFTGNHFWKILFHLFNISKPLSYSEKIALIKEKRIALWDVFKSCERAGALDSAIRHAEHNNIPGLLKNFLILNIYSLTVKSPKKFIVRNLCRRLPCRLQISRLRALRMR